MCLCSVHRTHFSFQEFSSCNLNNEVNPIENFMTKTGERKQKRRSYFRCFLFDGCYEFVWAEDDVSRIVHPDPGYWFSLMTAFVQCSTCYVQRTAHRHIINLLFSPKTSSVLCHSNSIQRPSHDPIDHSRYPEARNKIGQNITDYYYCFNRIRRISAVDCR